LWHLLPTAAVPLIPVMLAARLCAAPLPRCSTSSPGPKFTSDSKVRWSSDIPTWHLLRGRISARVLTGTWAEGEASDILAPFAGISYVVFGSWDLGKPLSSPT